MGVNYSAFAINIKPDEDTDIIKSMLNLSKSHGKTGKQFGITNDNHAFVGFAGDWVFVWSRFAIEPIKNHDYDFDSILKKISNDRKVVYWAIEDVSGWMGYAVYSEGKVVESRWDLGDKTIINEGGLIDGETACNNFEDEWEVISIVEKIIRIDWDDFSNVQFEAFETGRERA